MAFASLWGYTPVLYLLAFFTLSDAAKHHHPRKGNHLGNLEKRDLSITANLPAGWSYQGCYSDSVGARALTGRMFSDAAMTEEMCVSVCSAAGFTYAAVEYSAECFCGNVLGSSAYLSAPADCSMACSGNPTQQCGGPDRMNVFKNGNSGSSSGPNTNPGPPGWTSLGCYTDSVGERSLAILADTAGGPSALTVAVCTQYCQTNGYIIAGVEYSGECYCGNAFQNGGSPAPDGSDGCNMACHGNATEFCGGPNRLNAYGFGPSFVTSTTSSRASTTTTLLSTFAIETTTSSAVPDTSTIAAHPTSTTFHTTAPTVPTTSISVSTSSTTVTTSTTVPTTTTTAQTTSTLLTTTTSSLQVTTSTTSVVLATSSTATGSTYSTTSTSSGSATTSTLSASATPTGWSALGCYTDDPGARSLTVGMAVPGGAANMTVGNCQAACEAAGFVLAGVEYSAECYCDNGLKNGGGPAPDGDAQCNMPCNGNATETCGGPNRLNVFAFAGAEVTGSPTGTATATGTGSAGALPTDWSYHGCWVDQAYGRILTSVAESASMTIETCVDSCIARGHHVAGLQYTAQCFCGDAVLYGGVLAASDSECAMPCGGNSSQICGGPNRMSIYSNINFTAYPNPAPQEEDLPDGWEYEGCLAEAVGFRVLPHQIDNPTNNSAVFCLSLCAEYGYSAAGLQYGEQCFCGDDTDRVNAAVVFRPEADCGTVCPGNLGTICGGGGSISYYTAPITEIWGQAYGNAAGEYQFLIGGPVIPLITAAAVNGKVTFVEKHGTGPPNSTGAYELDVTQIDDFDQAWRTMVGLKTDVFCAAGLTLPDKAGRQLNIGGWSADSLFGIRFYWPDGSPGVAGVNDWEENVNEVALQAGRWYPTAMQMVNGSILVVGGEDGSNGPPVPNLEVIPRPAGGSLVHCDWLDRTDPYNLYPYLAVLPTGNILVAYYNEARILDERTFDTIRTLPNIPGAVNNVDAGRTYPLEGTAMLLPQHAPYTEPLGVLICGGSTPYGGHALDNCVSMQPEVPGAEWLIERMPSRRVISCMTALPDGTFVILNGAHKGIAGFGLAEDPNHNAVLYDPYKPAHSRMTRLANTTIDRMYHSEAILLQDGRVLVSGSDPQGEPYPQEYRVEVFVPPYLMGVSAASRPQFTMANNDWEFGGSYQIVMTNGAAAKVSLNGAVSSTHGNSMGQRTIFPSVSCSGNTCIITAPPNGYITGGPGWFMLFVLDAAGVPSEAQWVRIGGDPAGLGNWPDFPDFSLPGV